MSRSLFGLFWALAFVFIEALQYVYFGNIFQRMNSYLFGAIVFGISAALVIGAAAIRTPDQMRAAGRNLPVLFIVNVLVCLSWIAILISVQVIEPAIAYTLGAGAMPLAAWAAHLRGIPEGDAPRNGLERLGLWTILASLAWLSVVTVAGQSGFVRGGVGVGLMGVALALSEGVMFTAVLVYCQRLDRRGIGPGAVFGLRFVLYVVVAAAAAAMGLDAKPVTPGAGELAAITGFGLLLIVPPLYALQRAVALISTLTISVLTALGPFLIFAMQMAEGRVSFAPATLAGLALFFAGSLLAAFGAVRATMRARPHTPLSSPEQSG